MRFFTVTAAAAFLLFSMTPAMSQPFDPMGQAGGWNVFYNQATGGCFMERKTDEDVVLQIGTEAALLGSGPSDSFGFLAVYVPGQAPDVANDEPLVIVEIGPNTYLGQSHRVVREGYYGGYVVSSGDNDLGWDLQNRKSMTVVTTNGGMMEINLLRSDIKTGIEQVIACQSEKS